MKDSFKAAHPIINFAYFCTVILCGMFFLHPVFLGISLVAAFLYSVLLNGKKAVLFACGFLVPMVAAVSVLNPVFNHQGATILGYFRDNPITLESIAYGVAAGLMFANMIIWFSCYNAVMTSDKFIYLFGKAIPSISLIFSMVLRFVSKFKAQAIHISNARKCIGRDVSDGNLLSRVKHGLKILSILATWALENSIDTADSMNSRGYGLKGRSSFSIFRFDGRDKSLLAVMVLMILVVLTGAVLGTNGMQFFPKIRIATMTPLSGAVFAVYAGFCFLPLILNWKEAMRWRYLQSKI